MRMDVAQNGQPPHPHHIGMNAIDLCTYTAWGVQEGWVTA